MKKLALTFGLAAVASLALVACGGSSSSSTSTPPRPLPAAAVAEEAAAVVWRELDREASPPIPVRSPTTRTRCRRRRAT